MVRCHYQLGSTVSLFIVMLQLFDQNFQLKESCFIKIPLRLTKPTKDSVGSCYLTGTRKVSAIMNT
ncbi:hypothetical protein [Vibrio gallaecicus]|uniref:hypothetical protein n=1 Tax=Vibrio gallaecicus TaxID=552386 RepID=UPI0025B32896|nr:hypothetical protein [Vibrio gallaecicus]MDN3613035.1 hypothetical protein [Vibrio gallaecicus]